MNHYWSFCDLCDTDVVICGTCGNNCCSGGYGEVIGPEPGTTMKCPDCKSAYEMQHVARRSYFAKMLSVKSDKEKL